jgi:enoyl-CoA hydratase/carnithine racemase
MGILWSLPQRIGLAQAKKLMFSARTVLAEESLMLGIADELAEVGGAVAAAVEIGTTFAAGAPIAIAMTKSAYCKGLATLEDALRMEVDVQPSLYLTQDHQGAVSAFLEKRAPPPFRSI